MDGDQKQRHCCKVCGKSFPSGRSLGGHMRSHISSNSLAKADARPESSRGFPLAGTGAGYILRENPRKTWRLSSSIGVKSSMSESLCRECGKGFPSWRSLFGHMRCHSVRRRADEQELEEQEGSWSLGGDKQCLEEHSDTEEVVPRSRRRSKHATVLPESSSSVCEYEKEDEDVALSLMMLSRNAAFSIAAESSDKNSVILEDKRDPEEFHEYEIMNEKKAALERNIVGNGLKKVDSDVSDNLYTMEDEFKKPEIVSDGKEKFDCSLRRRRLSSIDETERNNFSSKRGGLYDHDANRGKLLARIASRVPEKQSQYECTTCNKAFSSYQALGGHCASHKRTNGCLPLKIDDKEIKIDPNAYAESALMGQMINGNSGTETSYRLSKKDKGHECTICGKAFSSGQALGGHKRSHLIASSNACHQTIIIQQQAPVMHDMLDLNLPAPVESSDTSRIAELKPWWIKGELKSTKPLTSLISN